MPLIIYYYCFDPIFDTCRSRNKFVQNLGHFGMHPNTAVLLQLPWYFKPLNPTRRYKNMIGRTSRYPTMCWPAYYKCFMDERHPETLSRHFLFRWRLCAVSPKCASPRKHQPGYKSWDFCPRKFVHVRTWTTDHHRRKNEAQVHFGSESQFDSRG